MQITNCGRGVHRREVVGIDRLKGLPADWYAFTNLDLATGPGRSREIDVILVASDRIFLVDLKDWNGRIESEGGNWLHNGRDCGASPVGKIHQNAKDIARLLGDDVRRRGKSLIPRVVGLVVVTGKADLTGIAGGEINSVFGIDDFLKSVSTPSARVGKFGGVAPLFVQTPLTSNAWKDQLSKFFNARTGPLTPGRRRYGTFIASSGDATFEHPKRIFAEYEVSDENATQTLGTLRLWDFTKAHPLFQSAEGRAEIAGRERSVVEYLRDRNESCESAILQPKSEDPDRGVSYWEVYDRRRRMKRLSDFTKTERNTLTPEGRIELVRQLLSKVSLLHGLDAAHLDIGNHSVWLETPSTVKLSHFMATSYHDVRSLGEHRYQFLCSTPAPEDVLGGGSDAKRKDVFLLGVAAHCLIFGQSPKCTADDMPPEWSLEVDRAGTFETLHSWFEVALALVPSERYANASVALDAFNAATASRPTPREVIEGLDRFRAAVRSQKQMFSAFPETELLRESDRLDIWKSAREGQALFIKMWKRAAWGDQVREGPRILDFLLRAHDLSLSPPPNCARIREVLWLGDAIAIIQDAIVGENLIDVIARSETFWERPEDALVFIKRLAQSVVLLHERRITHGDLKPENVLVIDDDGPAPMLVDLIDFSASVDGDIRTTAYSPATGGRMERDRYAVTKITEEILARCALAAESKANIARAIAMCRMSVPENGTLLPLIEAVDGALAPTPDDLRVSIRLSMKNAKTGQVMADEGYFYVRRIDRRLYLRGACEEIEITLDHAERPVSGRVSNVDQKRIGRFSKYEFMTLAADISIVSSTHNDFEALTPLLEDPEFRARRDQSHRPPPAESPQEEDVHKAYTFEDAKVDELSEALESEPSAQPRVDVKTLWRRLIDAEGDLTTDGTAEGDSSYNRNIRRHLVPFELTSGTFEFNRNDTVGVERLDRKGFWRRIGELDISRSKPDRVVIEATDLSPGKTCLVAAEERLRFTSHFEVQSLKRRESAISRILSRQSRIANLIDVFEPLAGMMPTEGSHVVHRPDLERYQLNPAQIAAFEALVRVRPVGLLQGPPGTGKTVFIAALVHYALTHGLAQNVLLASQSHEAVNNAAEAVLKLYANGIEPPSILRVGNENVVSDRLLPFHSDRVEQLYKDRFRAEVRDRLRIGARALGLSAALTEDIIYIETTIRPVVRKIADFENRTDPDNSRISNLRSTLIRQIAHLGLAEVAVSAESADVSDLIDNVLIAVGSRVHPDERVSPDRITRLCNLAQIGRDFVSSVSTAQRGFETFLAGTRQIVAGTCVGLGRPSLGLTTTAFDLVIIDEAARCTASELSVPMQAGRWIVLVGDHAQLEPHHEADIIDKVAAETQTSIGEVLKSDFERLFTTQYGVACGKTLTTQYRMLPPIGRVVSATFYEHRLEHARELPEVDPTILHPDLEKPITWISTDSLGERGSQRSETTGTSLMNTSEADLIVTLLKRWREHDAFQSWVTTQTKHSHVIGIICMYAAQRDLIRKKVHLANFPDAFKNSIKIDTVDSYQGKENLIVILSLVRNNVDGVQEGGAATIKPGYLSRPNRVNVAFSRAMDRLVIVGSKGRWKANSPMAELSTNVSAEVRTGEARILRASDILEIPTSPSATSPRNVEHDEEASA